MIARRAYSNTMAVVMMVSIAAWWSRYGEMVNGTFKPNVAHVSDMVNLFSSPANVLFEYAIINSILYGLTIGTVVYLVMRYRASKRAEVEHPKAGAPLLPYLAFLAFAATWIATRPAAEYLDRQISKFEGPVSAEDARIVFQLTSNTAILDYVPGSATFREPAPKPYANHFLTLDLPYGSTIVRDEGRKIQIAGARSVLVVELARPDGDSLAFLKTVDETINPGSEKKLIGFLNEAAVVNFENMGMVISGRRHQALSTLGGKDVFGDEALILTGYYGEDSTATGDLAIAHLRDCGNSLPCSVQVMPNAARQLDTEDWNATERLMASLVARTQ